MSLPSEQLTNPVYSKPFRVRDPSVFHRNGSYYLMLLMGDAAGYTTFGLLTSVDGLLWEPLEERSLHIRN